MLQFNLKRMARLRGITNLGRALSRMGFKNYTAERYVKGEQRLINPAHLEKFCLLFNCTPNDLFDWQPDELNDESQFELSKLLPDKEVDIIGLTQNIPKEKFPALKEVIEQFKGEAEK